MVAAAVSVVFSVISQMPYFTYYQLTDASDIRQISDRLPVDATVPVDSGEQIRLTIEGIQDILVQELKLQNSSDIVMDLRERLAVKEDWSVGELDALWMELTAEYSELNMLMPGCLSNSFVNNARKSATAEELFQYAYSGHDFAGYLAVEFGQSLSLVISVLLIAFFSALFLDDVKQGMSDILHINAVSPGKMIYGKYLSALALAAGCIGIDIISVNIMQLLYVKNVTFGQLLVVWGNVFVYCFPTIVFLSSVSALLLANFVSGCFRVLADGSRRQLWIAPFLVNVNSFFDPLSQEAFAGILLNRLAFCLLGIAMLRLTVLTWKKSGSVERSRTSFRLRLFDISLFSPKSFFFYNAKIVFNKGKLAALLVVFSMPFFSVNVNTDIINVSRSILLMTGWASVILFANIKSVEYTDNTADLYRLSARRGLADGIRFLICLITIVVFAAVVFFLSLYRIHPRGYRFDSMADAFIRMTISCVVCACFVGSVVMTAGYVFKRAWQGLAFGFVVNVLLSQIKTASIFNLYWFYYFSDNESMRQWLMSAGFYLLMFLAVFVYNLLFLPSGKSGLRITCE